MVILCCFDCVLAVFDCFWYSLGRPVTIGTPMVIFAVLTVFWLFSVHCWFTIGTVLVDMLRLVHQWSFLCCLAVFWLFVTVFGTVLVDLWRLVHQWSFFLFDRLLTVFDCFLRLVHRWYTVGTVLVDLWRLVHQWFWVFWRSVQCTIRQKQSKDSQNSNNRHWCTNRHMSTQSPPNTQSRANAATLRNLHHMCLGSGHSPSPVGRADCMCLHGRPCIWLPFAAACSYTLFYLLMMPAARL